MNDQTDPFDPKRFQVSPEEIARVEAAGKKRLEADQLKRVAVKEGAFVKVLYGPALAVAGRRQNAYIAMLVELTHQVFRQHTKTVELPNVKLRSVGIRRNAKVRALRQLEADGAVAVDWRGGRKTPHVTLLWR